MSNKSLSSNHQKYLSKNPVKRLLVNSFLQRINQIVKECQSKNICDLGCGEGFTARFLINHNHNLRIKCFDYNLTALKKAQNQFNSEKVEFNQINVLEASKYIQEKFDTILFLEVLEHIKDYHQALTEISKLKFDWLIISIPNEPWFSLGNLLFLKNINRLGRDPDHINFWNQKTASNLINQYFKIEKVWRPFPWTIFKLKKKI